MTDAAPTTFAVAAIREAEHIAAARAAHSGAQPSGSHDHVALALSGGGIRSASFSLGVLQSLARGGYLPQIDYLSTVSGGGYIGAWLSAWIHRRGLATVVTALESETRESSEIVHIRRFSNYLTPKLGLTSADSWTAVAIYLRNTLLNQAVLLPLLMLLLLFPWAVIALVRLLATTQWWKPFAAIAPHLLLLAPAVIVTMVVGVWSSVKATRSGDIGETTAWEREGVAVRAMMGALFASLLLAHWLSALPDLPQLAFTHEVLGQTLDWPWPVYGALIGALFALCLLVTTRVRAAQHPLRRYFAPTQVRVAFVVAATVSGIAFALGLYAVEWLLQQVDDARVGLWFVSGVGTLAVATAMLLSIVLFFGLMGRLVPESFREWQASLGAWLLILGGGWAGLCLLTFVAPPVMASMQGWMRSGGFATWLGGSAIGALLGSAKESGALGSANIRTRLLELAPSLFVLGMLAGLAYAVFELLAALTTPTACAHLANVTSTFDEFLRHDCVGRHVHLGTLALFALPCAILVAVLGYRVDVNLFSLHAFYRNRLARCFLGASHTRTPNPVTGFDPKDDVDLAAMTATATSPPLPQRPLHIVNAALNLTTANDLAWQERMAASFAMTPYYSGYGLPHGPLRERYSKTVDHRSDAPRAALHLSTAMAISGAAASPNMGFHTSPAVAFLMAMFNLRLGWWMPNPGVPKAWRQHTPIFSTTYLVRELLGQTDETANYVYLSDGGHFDNMGLYELVRRRCRYIILCDAEEDMSYACAGIGDAIRKCRIDFGAEIDIDLDAMRGSNGRHFGIGSIRYVPAANDVRTSAEARTGTLVYIKASTLELDRLPADVRSYARANCEFPHESTSDQWFSESQFESYRKLGEWIAADVFPNDPNAATVPDRLAQRIRALEADTKADAKADAKAAP